MRIKCGFSQAKITPQPEKVFMDGYGFRMEHAKGIRDELYVKALAIEDRNGTRFCMLSFDLCGFNEEVSEILRFHISQKTGLDGSSIALTATHTHAGPACGVLYSVPLNNDYLNKVGEVAGDCANEAFSKLEVCKFTSRFGKDLDMIHNRRNLDAIDRSVRVGCFFNKENVLSGLIARASCHPVLMSDMYISADYPSVLTKKGLEMGSCFMFLQGSCGDINPMVEGVSQEEKLEKLGGELAKCVLDAIKIEKVEGHNVDVDIDFKLNKIKVPMKAFSPADEVEREIDKYLKAYYDAQDEMNKRYILQYLNWYREISKKIYRGENGDIQVPLQYLKVGNKEEKVIFIFLPFEVLTRTALKIEDRLVAMGYEKENIYIVGYSNTVYGYLIPEEEIGCEKYENKDAPVWYNTALFDKDSEKIVIEEIFRMV
ncbi:MAG TPA: hypothetical protein GXZ66_05625 [Clostridiaceae bacterium]|jgi:hypothetical protein|nr:hypothetical protein [Clostridiaceae bacterium]